MRNVAVLKGSAPRTDYRYELRRGDEVIATGHLSRDQPLGVGERISIGCQAGIVREVVPLLGERELRLVVQLTRDVPGGLIPPDVHCGVYANSPSDAFA